MPTELIRRVKSDIVPGDHPYLQGAWTPLLEEVNATDMRVLEGAMGSTMPRRLSPSSPPSSRLVSCWWEEEECLGASCDPLRTRWLPLVARLAVAPVPPSASSPSSPDSHAEDAACDSPPSSSLL